MNGTSRAPSIRTGDRRWGEQQGEDHIVPRHDALHQECRKPDQVTQQEVGGGRSPEDRHGHRQHGEEQDHRRPRHSGRRSRACR